MFSDTLFPVLLSIQILWPFREVIISTVDRRFAWDLESRANSVRVSRGLLNEIAITYLTWSNLDKVAT